MVRLKFKDSAGQAVIAEFQFLNGAIKIAIAIIKVMRFPISIPQWCD